MRIALLTANIGGIDKVIEPTKQNIPFDYFCYTENNLPFPLPNLSNRMKGKYLKMLTHRFLPNYDLYIWIDGHIEITDPKFINNILVSIQNKECVLSKHLTRDNVYEEIDYIQSKIKEGNKYLCSRYENEPWEEEKQFYRENNLPQNYPLYNGYIFTRLNNPRVNDIFEDWWLRSQEYTMFDQCMLSFVAFKHSLSIDINKLEGIILHKHTKENSVGNNLKNNELLATIKDKLQKKTPFAFIRYGDGESMVLKGGSGCDFVMQRQLGKRLGDVDVAHIQNDLISAYQLANVIGFPQKFHLDRKDNWSESQDVFIDKVGQDYFDKKLMASIDSCYDFLYAGHLNDLLMNADTVNYISCRNLDDIFKEKFGIKNVNSFIIAPEKTFTSGYTGDQHFPTQYNQIKEWINNIDCKGNLCLVGAGVVGKIYGIFFRDAGGISLDLGGVFDLWAGKKTRGEGKGMDVAYPVYKLKM
jgi:hypothetical protein